MSKKITKAQARRELRPRRLRKGRAGGDGNEFPFRVAKVTRVDAVRRTVALYCFTGNTDTYDNVALTNPSAGARHFLGSVPEVNDLCVIGYSPAESGSSRVPYIVGWLIPGTDSGYDWVTTSVTREGELPLTPALREALQGTFGRRRHKLRQMEAGNVGGSSSQGADFLLNEGVYLANRRGNEIHLRDQDQALVTRSLQQFHAGAGVRMYSGMVQRDGTLLPTQMFEDDVDWAADKQIDAEGKALPTSELEETEEAGGLNPADVFSSGLGMGYSDPTKVLRRGLYIDQYGNAYDDKVVPSAVYGGKPLYRVSTDPTVNGVNDPAANTFTEWRVEVSHTSDGTLPVTEQTDGVDIDRLLPSPPGLGLDGSGDPNELNRSENASMVSMVLGTAVGNDPINDRDSYGKPLVASLYDETGAFAPGVRAAGRDEGISEHAAFLIRVRNPQTPNGPEAFMAITKGGAFRTYFPGTGSKAHEEFYQSGKQVSLGADKDGQSYLLETDGTINLVNTGRGRPSDNIGLNLRSEGGAVSIYGGAPITEGGGTPSTDPNLTTAGQQLGVRVESANSALYSAVNTLKVAAQVIRLEDSNTILVNANNSVEVNSGDTVSVTTKVLGVTVNGKAEYNYGGPKDGLPTNGPSRTTTFSSTPSTGGIGGVVDEYLVQFGKRDELFRVGKSTTTVKLGGFFVDTMSTARVRLGNGNGVTLTAGLPGTDNQLNLTPSSASLVSNLGTASVKANLGTATVQGSLGVFLKSALTANITAPYVSVSTPTPFIGGVLTDGCLNPFTGTTYFLSGSIGVPTFRVG